MIYTNIVRHGNLLTTYLLMITIFMAIYLAFIRTPKVFFKQNGFYFANAFILYNRIKTMNLSENGILIVGLEKSKIHIQVKHLDDLQKIYDFFINHK
ncbi:Predicted membrane protein [Providencia rustigianii]|nr:Predicted membrane protein [Providencia rustigianii]